MHSVRTGLLVACLIVTTCPPAHADPGPSAGEVAEAREAVRDRSKQLGATTARLAEAQARLDDLHAKAEQLVEAYNGELVRLSQAKKTYEEAKARLEAAEVEVEAVRGVVAVIAAETYGGINYTSPAVGMIGDRAGPEGFLHRVHVLEQLGGERSTMLGRMRDTKAVSEVLRTQAENAFAEQQVASERAEKAKAVAERAMAEQTRETKVIEAEKEQLQGKVDAARSTAERLARQRSEALERARLSDFSPKWLSTGSGSRMGDAAANWALTQLGKPYVWAADGPSSYDCSGLTMRAWEKVGVGIDHWTGTQWTSGPHIPLNQLRRGDLLFFGYVSSDPGTIHHVGMYIGRGLMVHAPQTGDVVRIASMWRRDLVGATRPS